MFRYVPLICKKEVKKQKKSMSVTERTIDCLLDVKLGQKINNPYIMVEDVYMSVIS